MSYTFSFCCCGVDLRKGVFGIGIYYGLSYLVLASYTLTIANKPWIIGGEDIDSLHGNLTGSERLAALVLCVFLVLQGGYLASYSFVNGIIVFSFSGLISSLCLVLGTIEESTMLLAVWLAVHSMMPIVALAAVVWGTVMMAIHSNVEHIFIVLFPSLAAIGVLMYFIVVVHSYRMQLKSNRVQDVERFPASYVTNKKSLAIPQRRGKYPSNDFY